MPLFYQDVDHILSFRLKSEVIAYPQYQGVDYANALHFFNMHVDETLSLITDEESKHCFKIFMQQCKELHSSLTLSLLRQNATYSLETRERILIEDFYITELILMSGIVKEKSDIERVINKWFPNDSWDSGQRTCKNCLNYVLTLSEAIQERCSLYNCKKSELVPRCEKCSGGPCIDGDFGANNASAEANLEKTGDNCLLEHAYLNCAKEIHDLIKLQDSKRNFDEHLTWKGAMARRAIQTRALGGSRGYYTVEEAVEVKLKEQIRHGISHLRSRAEDWIIRKSPKQGGMRMPFLRGGPSRFLFFPIFAAFSGFIMRSQM